MTRAETADIVLVGDGLAALALLRALRPPAPDVLVLSRPAVKKPDNRGLALSLSSKEILREWGVWEDLRPVSQPIERVRVSEQNHDGSVWLAASDIGQPALGYTAPAHALATALAGGDHAAPHRVIEHMGVREISVRDDRVHILSDTRDGPLRTSAKLLVAADGDRSGTARLAGATLKTFDYRQTAIVTEVEAPHPHRDTAYEHFTPGGPMASLPLPDNRRKLVLTFDRDGVEDALNLPERELLRRCAAISDGGDDTGWRIVGEKASYPLRRARLVTDRALGRWLALGNAAGVTHPNAAQGFNLCLRDTACLARHLTRPGMGDEPWLAAYHDQRRQDRAKTALLADGLASLYRSNHFAARAARRLGVTMVKNAPYLRGLLLRRATGMAALSNL